METNSAMQVLLSLHRPQRLGSRQQTPTLITDPQEHRLAAIRQQFKGQPGACEPLPHRQSSVSLMRRSDMPGQGSPAIQRLWCHRV